MSEISTTLVHEGESAAFWVGGSGGARLAQAVRDGVVSRLERVHWQVTSADSGGATAELLGVEIPETLSRTGEPYNANAPAGGDGRQNVSNLSDYEAVTKTFEERKPFPDDENPLGLAKDHPFGSLLIFGVTEGIEIPVKHFLSSEHVSGDVVALSQRMMQFAADNGGFGQNALSAIGREFGVPPNIDIGLLTTTETVISAEYANGDIVVGEKGIGVREETDQSLPVGLTMHNRANNGLDLSRRFMSALRERRHIIGPGSLATSIGQIIAIPELQERFGSPETEVIKIVNAVGRYTVAEELEYLERFLGPGAINTIIVNTESTGMEAVDPELVTLDDVTRERAERGELRVIRGKFWGARKAGPDFDQRIAIGHDPALLAAGLRLVLFNETDETGNARDYMSNGVAA